MARTLTVSRVRVRAGQEGAYLAAVRELAALHEGRGRHLWVFRRAGERAGERPGERPGEPSLFLEFSESREAASHRAVAEPPADERAIEARIRAIAEYEAGSWDLWEEVRSQG